LKVDALGDEERRELHVEVVLHEGGLVLATELKGDALHSRISKIFEGSRQALNLDDRS